MDKVLDEARLYEIYTIVDEIPVGFVATYGQIAKLIGLEKNARMVGKALRMASMYGKFPCHRVVNHNGRIAPGWFEQVQLLKDEGVTFKDEFHVDMKKHQWNNNE